MADANADITADIEGATGENSDAAKEARRWIAEIDRAEKWREPYRKRAKLITRLYRNQQADEQGRDSNRRKFALLWSNIQTLGPAVYARPPQCVVTRRYKDADPVGRYASEVLERGVNFGIDEYDFDDQMKLARDSYLLVGQGQLWVRYVPHEAAAPAQVTTADEPEQITNDAATAEAPPYAEALCDQLDFDEWGYQPARKWKAVGYVYRFAYLTRRECIKRFGRKIGGKVPLDYGPQTDDGQDGEAKERVKRAAIVEIWDKTTGNVIWISRSWPHGPLDKRPDPLSLKDFFPCPRPLMATTPQDKYIPVPDYVYYQDQAEEVDEITARIALLVDALRMVGVHDAEYGTTLANAFNGRQNELIPVQNWAMLQDKGGAKGIIEWFPIADVITTLTGCFEARGRILEDVYQITGISDIIRGATDPNETATAQGLKSQWGSLRVRDRQKELARFARDALRLKAEIIAKKFPIATLRAMTDVKLLTQAEKEQTKQLQAAYQSVAAQSQQLGVQPPPPPQIPPETMRAMELPTWEEVDGLLKNDALRTFRVDVETDSTIEPNETEEKQRRVEFAQAIGGLIGAATPAVQAAPQLAPLVGETIKFVARGFRVGREMEDVIERVFDQIAQMKPPAPEGKGPTGPTPQELQIKAGEIAQRAQNDAEKNQIEAQRVQQDGQIAQADIALRTNEQRLEAAALARDPNPQSTN